MTYGPDDQVERDAPDAPFEQLTGILRARLGRGDWRVNRAIPSENALANEYGLSRPTVRRALAALAEEGFVYAVSGRGTFVTDREPAARAERPNEGA
ncbi:GntR family transcriptional regulator [Streptomyces sp. NBC_01387]|uniref:GntR family transcriptional regulator n=1 Tax=Streptomyces sp. NBC_01387 TaxID=2903849 RepID=UPI00324A994C